MFHKRTKTRKLRGHVSHGYGRVGKHRKHPGGRGKCGGLTHHKTLFKKYHPDYFGKRGLKIFHRKTQALRLNATNTGDLFALIRKNEFVEGQAPIIDCRAHGIHKVLGRGELSLKQPLVVIAKQFTEEAKRKIEAVGGRVIVSA